MIKNPVWLENYLIQKVGVLTNAKHATCEQYHSEFKSDLDIERLPSRYFDTNALVLSCAALIYNILRWIGQNMLLGSAAPARHPVKRRRMKTIIREIIYLAAKITCHANRLRLVFCRYSQTRIPFQKLYEQLV